MKLFFDGVIVVEGTSDSSYLSSFINALFIETNGYDIKQGDLEFLTHFNKRIIILTDSDEAGNKIREKLNKSLNNPINVLVDPKQCNKNGKHGVAECSKEEVLNKLSLYLNKDKAVTNVISLRDLIDITNNEKSIKEFISLFFHLGTTKNKEMLKRLNVLEINKNIIEREVEAHYGNK